MDKLKNYPVQFIEPALLKDGTIVQLRPIHPLDGAQAAQFRAKLSIESIFDRFLGYVPSITDKLVKQLTEIDYSREMAIVVEMLEEEQKQVIAVARIVTDEDVEEGAEFAIIIADDWQGKGLGSVLTDYMIKVAKSMGFEKVNAVVFTRNTNMIGILKERDFVVAQWNEGTTSLVLEIGGGS